MRTEAHFEDVLQRDQFEGETDLLEKNKFEIRRKKKNITSQK